MAASAVQDLAQIPPRYRSAVIAFLSGPMADNPYGVGTLLYSGLAGSRSGRRGAYRVLYTILQNDNMALVHRITHLSAALPEADNAYRPVRRPRQTLRSAASGSDMSTAFTSSEETEP